jgi:hypothetical protein
MSKFVSSKSCLNKLSFFGEELVIRPLMDCVLRVRWILNADGRS